MAAAQDWPWMAEIVLKNKSAYDGLLCGASLIANKWILTAAHCVYDKTPFNFDIIVNQNDLAKEYAERLNAQTIIIHPEFNAVSLDNDIALIEITTEITQIQPIALLTRYESLDQNNQTSIALGWGSTSIFEDSFPYRLRQVNLSLINNQQCSLRMGETIPEGMLCAGDDIYQRDTCLGDSGGPLIAFDETRKTWKQIGITSWGFGCAEPEFYGVYTRIKHYSEFIEKTMCSAQILPTPQLYVNTEENNIHLNWTGDASGYRLIYAPYPSPQSDEIASIDLQNLTRLSAQMPSGSAYYLAIMGYRGNCNSPISNIEYFVVN